MLKKLSLFLLAALALTACDDDKDNGGTTPLPTPPDGYVYATRNEAIGQTGLDAPMLFFGSSEVTTEGQSGKYTDPVAQFEFRYLVGEDKDIYLYMHAARFAAAGMPDIEMRLTASHIIDKGTLSMSGLSIIPQWYVAATESWMDNSKFTITNFKAFVDGTFCTVTFTCAGKYALTYRGRLIVESK